MTLETKIFIIAFIVGVIVCLYIASIPDPVPTDPYIQQKALRDEP